MSKTDRVKKDGMSKVDIRRQEQSKQTFLNGGPRIQAKARRINASGEKIIHNQKKGGNSFIVLGFDRVDSRASGYGGAGDTHCDSIDIVAGLGGHSVQNVNQEGKKVYTEPNFIGDAARIYLSQKTDVDLNFHLASGSMGFAENRSGIVVKADGLRFVANEGIKLISTHRGTNSLGGKTRSVRGIDLIAGNNDTGLQPLVKGKNLLNALVFMVAQINNLTTLTHGFVKYQMEYNKKVQAHVHYTKFYGKPSLKSDTLQQAGFICNVQVAGKTEASVFFHLNNLVGLETNYLKPSGPYFILSRYNNTN